MVVVIVSRMRMLRIVLFIVTFTVCQCQHPVHNKGWCETGWKQNWEELTCVKYSSVLKDRDGAPLYCQGMGSSLVSITNKDKLDFVIRNSRDRDSGYWIDGPYSQWKWSPIKNLIGETKDMCVKTGLRKDQGFNRVACDKQLFPICERSVDSLATTTCTDGWVYFSDKHEKVCLRGLEHRLNYTTAVAHCSVVGGLLAMPTSKAKYETMLGSITNKHYQENWVGIRASPNTGVLVYSDGAQVPGCQVLRNGSEKVTVDVDCDSMENVACEKPMALPKSWCKHPYVLDYDDGKCVWFVVNLSMSRGRAAEFCKQRGGGLMNVEDKRRLEFVKYPKANPFPDDFLIGSWYTDDDGPEDWSPIEYLPDRQGLLCVTLDDELALKNCTVAYPYICERTPNPSLGCGGAGWKRFQTDREDICLKAFNDPTKFFAAINKCPRHGHLAMPTSEKKLDAIKNVQYPRGNPHWIGMLQRESYYDGIVTYSNGTEIPACRLVGHNIIGLSKYQNCSTRKHFICEKPVSLQPDGLTCPDRWLFNWGDMTCVGYFLSSKTFPEAQDFCDSQRGKVMEMTSPRKKKFLTHSRRAPQGDYWIASSYETPRTWSPVQLLAGKIHGKYCVTMLPGDEGLMKMDCQSKAYAVCEINRRSIASGDCNSAKTQYQDENEDVCLFLLKEYIPFNDAASKCVEKGGLLAIPSSPAKFKAIQNQRHQHPIEHWVGVYFSKASRLLQYSDGTEVPTCQGMNPYSQGIGGYETCSAKKLVVCETPMIGAHSRLCEEEGWIPYYKEETCIAFFESVKTWQEAGLACKAVDAWPVKVTDSDKAELIDYGRPLRGKEYWTGVVYTEAWFPKEWSIVDVHDVNMTTDCAGFSYDRIVGMHCGEEHYFVCEDVVEEFLGCEKESNYFHDYADGRSYCFIAIQQEKTFREAIAYCESHYNGTLAMPTDLHKFNAIKAATLPVAFFWIGLKPDMVFSNVLTYHNGTMIPSCRSILPYSSGFSPYQFCDMGKYYICERDADNVQ